MKVNDVRYDVLGTALRKMFFRKAVDVTNIYASSREPMRFGINWAACGTKTVDEADVFARELRKAMEIAEYLTSLEMVIKYLEDDEEDKFIKTGNDFQSATESMMSCLEDFNEFDKQVIKAFLENVEA